MNKRLGKLNKVNLREYWAHEALDFTQWLAKEENIQLLSDEIGVSLVNVRPEEAIGRYNVDLVATDEDSERKVIIENQLEYTDHKHLGQIITYASGYNASMIIWIVKEVREEHQKAMEWLNNNTSADLSFFLIRMELWQIGDSPFAPKFHIIVEPNDWAKALQESTTATKELTDTKLSQLDFWKQFMDYAKSNNTILRIGRKARAQHWYNISFGTSDAHIALTISTRDNVIASSIYISRSPELFDKFKLNKEAIEEGLGFSLEWQELEGRLASRITVGRNADLKNEEEWETYFSWLLEKAEKMAKEFSKYY
ncbi:DUF4268 domain-containing protein [Maribacter sp. Hel_I_7]|uniref:DUF4268 domain-containing protein n=1 Tax=Maribacter sp. Hel_I_7 TaxID=1249997 RepID=UPI00047EB35B|nr:DUF4268 domain-containing protein [Maribacter sp. Hel_I_7]